jgi:hypothetical protein
MESIQGRILLTGPHAGPVIVEGVRDRNIVGAHVFRAVVESAAE